MSRRRSPVRWSAREWLIRGGLGLLAAVLGYVSAVQTLGYTLRGRDPARAHALAPGDGRITAILAGSLSGPDATAVDRRRADDLARRALRQDATAVLAASTLAINAEIRGDSARARSLFGYAEALSRRDLQTQIFAIETAVAAGDVAGALRHYDIALRTSRNAPDLLFPILASAIADARVRPALIGTLRQRPAWGDSFVDYAAGHAPDARTMAALFRELRQAGLPVSEFAQTSAVNALIAAGRLDEAWSYYASIRPGADRRMSRDPRFTAAIGAPSPLDWVPVNDGGISTSIQRARTGGTFEFSVPSGVGGPLLQQMQMLPPGTYRLDGHAEFDQTDDVRLQWTLRCRDGRGDGMERVVLPGPDRASGTFGGMLSVPAGCPVQTLALVAQPSDALGGITGRIDRVRLVPAR